MRKAKETYRETYKAGDDTAWYVTDRHYDVSGCIVEEKDVIEVVKRGAVDPEVIPYLRAQEEA